MRLCNGVAAIASLSCAMAGFTPVTSATEWPTVLAQAPDPNARPAPTTSPVAAAPASRGVGWYVGTGIGAGIDPKYKLNGRTITFDDRLRGATEEAGPIGINLVNAGVTLGPNLLLGFSGSLVTQTGRLAGNDVRLQINNYLVAVTWFLVERGFFLRGGAGGSNIVIDTGTGTDRANGYGLLFGAGYALPFAQRHNITFTVDYSRQSYSGSTTRPESSQFGAAYLGYMYRR